MHRGLRTRGVRSGVLSSFCGTKVTCLKPLSFLVIDGYPRAARQVLQQDGVTSAGKLYQRLLTRQIPSHFGPLAVRCDIVHPSDDDFKLPVDFAKYDAVTWTGCSLAVYESLTDLRVARQIELARTFYALGIPQFGSCWASQIAVVAADGFCGPNRNGREMGLARKIALTNEGRSHPMFDGKPTVFDAFTSHNDEILKLPAFGALRLAANDFCNVQAVAVRYLKGEFWAVQYHPEFDLHEMARLVMCRRHKLIAAGLFTNAQQVERYVEDLDTLHRDPGRSDLAWRLGIDHQVLEPSIRECEARNFVRHLVLPTRLQRLALQVEEK